MTKTFADLETKLDLYRWRKGGLGTLYLPRTNDDPSSHLNRPLVRHFDTDRIAGLVNVYADVVGAVTQWVADRPEITEVVEVEPLTEIGVDYISRLFLIVGRSIHDLDHLDRPQHEREIIIPETLAPMRQIAQQHITQGLPGRAGLLEHIMHASLIGPSKGTVESKGKRFKIFSPAITIEQLEQWTSM